MHQWALAGGFPPLLNFFFLVPAKPNIVCSRSNFYHGHGHPIRSLIISNKQTLTYISCIVCKHYGVGKIPRHYRVGHGSVPCRPLFFYVLNCRLGPCLLTGTIYIFIILFNSLILSALFTFVMHLVQSQALQD